MLVLEKIQRADRLAAITSVGMEQALDRADILSTIKEAGRGERCEQGL